MGFSTLRARGPSAWCRAALLGALLVTAACAPAAAPVGDTPADPGPGVREVALGLTVPTASGGRTYRLVATEYRPRGIGPFPAVLISHGATPDPVRRLRTTGKFAVASELFTSWGLVVLNPVRRGYGRSDGDWDEHYGSCDDPHYVHAGLESAKDIAVALEWVRERPYVDPGRIALVGTSGGGWGSLAAASRGDLPIRGVVNFAGGRGGRRRGVANDNCGPERLVAAAGEYGSTARVPTLWLYSENDSFFGPDLARRMHRAYTDAGGTAVLRLLPPYTSDGHYIIDRRGAVPLWRDTVEAFFREIGLLRRP
jgi:dienelactone hydrolase